MTRKVSISFKKLIDNAFFLPSSYFRTHPITLYFSKYWGADTWAVPHLKFWGAFSESLLSLRPCTILLLNYTVSQKKTVQNCFCQNFVKFPSILIIFCR